jgi:hypothetical protein
MDFNKYIEESNKAFLEATPEQKRVMIAKDVLARMEADNLKASTGKVVAIKNIGSSAPLKEIVNSGIECEVCGKGALLCAIVGRVNEFSYGDIRNEENIHRPTAKYHQKLSEFFPLEQIDLIETAFEGTSYIQVLDNPELIEKAIVFGEKYDYAQGRLKAIMNNIIENKGTFTP